MATKAGEENQSIDGSDGFLPPAFSPALTSSFYLLPALTAFVFFAIFVVIPTAGFELMEKMQMR